MIEYSVIRSARKTCCIEIDRDARVVVRVPWLYPTKKIDELVRSKEKWIASHLDRMLKIPPSKIVSHSEREELRQKAKEILPERVFQIAKQFELRYRSVRISVAEKRFGSCSADHRISLSCYLILYPQDLIDYIILHELCHTVEHNHSASFYRLLDRWMPDWRSRKRMLAQMPLPHCV